MDEAVNNQRVMVVGGTGLLGKRIVEVLRDETGLNLVVATRNYLADTGGYERWTSSSRSDWKNVLASERWRPNVIINAAAMTDVDRCEFERKEAWETNVSLVETMATMCRGADIRFVQISTDYVFDGTSGPYVEEDKPNPINYYGKTKHAAENVCLRSGAQVAIVRTMWLYGSAPIGKKTFVDWLVEKLKAGEPATVVTDEVGTPTSIEDVAIAVVKAIEAGVEGLFHIAGPNLMSRWEWAERICDVYGLNRDLLVPVTSADLNRPAERPLRSGLLTAKARGVLGFTGTDLMNGMTTEKIIAEREVRGEHAWMIRE